MVGPSKLSPSLSGRTINVHIDDRILCRPRARVSWCVARCNTDAGGTRAGGFQYLIYTGVVMSGFLDSVWVLAVGAYLPGDRGDRRRLWRRGYR